MRRLKLSDRVALEVIVWPRAPAIPRESPRVRVTRRRETSKWILQSEREEIIAIILRLAIIIYSGRNSYVSQVVNNSRRAVTHLRPMIVRHFRLKTYLQDVIYIENIIFCRFKSVVLKNRKTCKWYTARDSYLLWVSTRVFRLSALKRPQWVAWKIIICIKY